MKLISVISNIIVFSLLSLYSMNLVAQKQSNHFLHRKDIVVGLDLSSNGIISAIAISGLQTWSLGQSKKRIDIGLGLRFTSDIGNSSVNYTTADPRLTRNRHSIGAVFAKHIPANIDTVTVSSTQVNALNMFGSIAYPLSDKWSVTLNLDWVGFSFGGIKPANLTYGEQSNATRKTNALPATFNAFLLGDNNRGSLISELMFQYQYKPNWQFKAGLNYLINEYVIEDPVLYTNSKGTVIGTDRFRSKSINFGIGINHIIQHKKNKS